MEDETLVPTELGKRLARQLAASQAHLALNSVTREANQQASQIG